MTLLVERGPLKHMWSGTAKLVSGDDSDSANDPGLEQTRVRYYSMFMSRKLTVMGSYRRDLRGNFSQSRNVGQLIVAPLTRSVYSNP